MASLAYDVTPNVTAYATWSNGFLAGGFNYYAADSLSTFYYQPEHTMNYEVGLKTNWFNRKLTANVAVFYTDIRDKQVREEDPAGGIGVWKFTNAGRAHSQGVEVELIGKPFAGLELQGGKSGFGARMSLMSLTPPNASATVPATCWWRMANRKCSVHR